MSDTQEVRECSKNGDTIRAVIRNSGTNQNGKTAEISMPNSEAQVQLMNRTYKAAGLDSADISYVEAHGTELRPAIQSRRPRFLNSLQSVGSISPSQLNL